MLIIVGLVIVLGSVVGGYLMAGGNLLVLNQPSEFIVIGGSAIGSLVISTPSAVLKGIVSQIKSVMGSGFTRGDYVDLLSLLYLVFKQVQQSGVMSLEAALRGSRRRARSCRVIRSSSRATTPSTSWPTRRRSSSSEASPRTTSKR